MDQEFMDEIDRDLLENGPGEQPHIRLAKAEQSVRELTAKNRRLEAELTEAREWKEKWETCEKWRKFYQEAKGKLYAMGGEVAEACWNNMPCNESQVDRWFRAEFVYKAAYDRVSAELAEARKDGERLDWLNNFIQCGCADFGFELDGGVYLRLDQPSTQTVDIREANDVRAAIDAARGTR